MLKKKKKKKKLKRLSPLLPKTFINYCHVHRDPQLSIRYQFHVFLAMCGFPEGHDGLVDFFTA